jgi:phospholipid transport system substrate-binding protein
VLRIEMAAMLGVRHSFESCLAVALIALAVCAAPPLASADMPNQEVADIPQSINFVDGLAIQAFAVLNDRSLSLAQRNKRFRTLLDRGFNVRYIALMALGPYCRDLDERQLDDYEARFDDFLLSKYAGLVESSDIKRFRTVDAERAGPRDALVHMIIVRGRDSLDTEWRVRIFDGEPRVIDVRVAGLSLVMSEREELGALIKQSGLAGLMSALRSYSIEKRA